MHGSSSLNCQPSSSITYISCCINTSVSETGSIAASYFGTVKSKTHHMPGKIVLANDIQQTFDDHTAVDGLLLRPVACV